MAEAAPMLAAQIQPVGSNAALITFAFYTLAVFALAGFSARLLRRRSFLSEYFLGSRSLGVWAFALTFAATSASGGSFMGFPAKIYTHGWVLSLWIASYMLVPIMLMGLLGKRLNQIARKTDSITIPDVLRNRFESAGFGTLATLLIVFFMTFNLIAQFKAGALMLSTLLDNVPQFQAGREWAGRMIEGRFLVGGVEPGYLMCLLSFSAAVILYTSYGGFRAVVWTDVLQGIVMAVGVLVLLVLALWKVGGLGEATDELAKMTPPRMRTAYLETTEAVEQEIFIPFGSWLEQPAAKDQPRRVFRTGKHTVIRAGTKRAVLVEDSIERAEIPVLEITTPEEIARIKVLPLQVPIAIIVISSDDYAYGVNRRGVYVRCPGPSANDRTGFLPLSLAISFFFFWTFSGAGQPSNMVRLMAFRSSQTFRKAIFTVAVYYSLIYFPLVAIFCCARLLLPGMEVEADRIMPAIAEHLTLAAGWPWLAGLLVAAPFAAVMSTVDSFLLMISSAVVRDIYQRDINPNASERTIRRLAYTVTALVGIAALLGALNPPEYLQDIIIFTGGGLSACFLVPMALALYWPRINTAGAVAGMSAGFLTHSALYIAGFFIHGGFQAVRIANFDPFLPELAASFLATVVVTLVTAAPPQHIVQKFFHRSA